MNILVVGLGGIGSIYALLLRRASIETLDLSFVARSNYATLKSSGIAIHSAKFGRHQLVPDAIYSSTEEASRSGKRYKYVFCTTKSLSSQDTINTLRPVVSSESTIVLIQNGLGIESPIHVAFPENTILSCAAYIGVWQTRPGVVEHSALEKLELGTYPEAQTLNSAKRRQQDEEAVSELTGLLREGGSDVTVVPSMDAARWRKLVWNASFNCVATLTNLDTHQITSSPPAKALVLAAMHEIIDVANASGHTMPESLVSANWENTKLMGVPYKPSMLLDFLARRELEIEVILGEPIRRAELLSVSVPTLRYLKQFLDVLQWKIKHERLE